MQQPTEKPLKTTISVAMTTSSREIFKQYLKSIFRKGRLMLTHKLLIWKDHV